MIQQDKIALKNINNAFIDNIFFQQPKVKDLSEFPQILEYLDGKISSEVRKHLTINSRREDGMFFTSEKISASISELLIENNLIGKKIVEPSFGSGNLFLEFLKNSNPNKKYNELIQSWSNLIEGYELHDELCKITKLRLSLFAGILSESNLEVLNNSSIQAYFPKLYNQNFLESVDPFSRCEVIISNPPFGSMFALDKIEWGRGKIQKAAVFLDKIIDDMYHSQHLICILPDVIRSGSRYEQLRNKISNLGLVNKIKVLGKFDKFTNVDVFLMHFIKGGQKKYFSFYNLKNRNDDKFSSFVNVSVGPVVPFRSNQNGSWKKYIVGSFASKTIISDNLNSTRFEGKEFSPPLVIVKRTSSPSQKTRISCHLVTGNKKFTIENHFLVIEPKRKTLKECKKIMRLLADLRTTNWMNDRIRCRHLTTKSILEIPWWKNEE